MRCCFSGGRYCKENLAKVFRLRFFSVDELQFVEFGDAVDEFAYLVAEFFAKLLVSHRRIFKNVMQKRGYDR